MSSQADIEALLARHFDEDDAAALDAACAALRDGKPDMSALLEWIARYPADRETRQLAERRVRAALGLGVVAGAPCRR